MFSWFEGKVSHRFFAYHIHYAQTNATFSVYTPLFLPLLYSQKTYKFFIYIAESLLHIWISLPFSQLILHFLLLISNVSPFF